MRQWASIIYEICWSAQFLLITCKECLDRSRVLGMLSSADGPSPRTHCCNCISFMSRIFCSHCFYRMLLPEESFVCLPFSLERRCRSEICSSEQRLGPVRNADDDDDDQCSCDLLLPPALPTTSTPLPLSRKRRSPVSWGSKDGMG